ncbi:MAG: hypothetical protein KAR47_03345, partial [Planctomycetes bacterium]|nr:hypothetical protein [Planctomycetota bacterium]
PGELQRRGAGERPNPQIIFDKRDSNDDGKLTPDEMGGKEKSERFFDNFDTNKDGVITIKEFSRMGEDRPGNMGKRGKREPKDDNN